MIFPNINSHIGDRKNVTRNLAASAHNVNGMTFIRTFHIYWKLSNFGSAIHELRITVKEIGE